MKNWMLVCCYDCNIKFPKFFNTKEEAVMAMCADVGDLFGMTPDEVMEARENKNRIDDCAYVGDDFAWSDRHISGDWKIFNLIGRV